MYSFSYLEPVCCSMSSSNCCFLACVQISQEADQVVWYSHLFQNFPQFIVIHIVKGFGILNKAEIDIFLELSCFFNDPTDVGNLISGSSAFPKISLNIQKTKIMSSGPITSWQIDGEKMENWQTLFSWAPKSLWMVICSHEISFHPNPKERQCQRVLKLPHNCTHLTH